MIKVILAIFGVGHSKLLWVVHSIPLQVSYFIRCNQRIYYAKKIYLNYNELHALWIYYAKKKYP